MRHVFRCWWGPESHPSLAGLSSTALIHIPVSLPLPAAGGKLKAVEGLRIHPGHIAPRPAVGGQQDVGEAIHRVPPLNIHTHKQIEFQHRWGVAPTASVQQQDAWADLVFIGLLPVTDGVLTGHDIEVNMVIAADAPAAPLPCSDALQLQQQVVGAHPLLAGCGQAVHSAVHIHGPQQCDGHGGPLKEEGRQHSTFQAVWLIFNDCVLKV